MYLKLKFLDCNCSVTAVAAALGEARERGTAALPQQPVLLLSASTGWVFPSRAKFCRIKLSYALDKSLNFFLFFCNAPL